MDFSAAAIREGRRLPGGDHPHLRWIEGPIESVAVDPPYCLITAGASMHWFDWDLAFARFARLLTSDGLFVAVGKKRINQTGCAQNWDRFLRAIR